VPPAPQPLKRRQAIYVAIIGVCFARDDGLNLAICVEYGNECKNWGSLPRRRRLAVCSPLVTSTRIHGKNSAG
jgi:hypothetical protein